MQKQEMLYEGKAKSLYKTENPDLLICEFRDDTSAFDGEKMEKLDNKGRVNNAISNYIMEYLAENGVETHIHSRLSPTETVVKKLDMLPVECVVRNVAAGSLCRRLGIAPGLVLERALFELFLKDDELHDPMINDQQAILFGWATVGQLMDMEELSLRINELLGKLFKDAGMTLVDAKYEFGVHQGRVILGDEISPDSCRIWDSETQEKLDKDRFRQNMGSVIASYEKIADKLGIVLTD